MEPTPTIEPTAVITITTTVEPTPIPTVVFSMSDVISTTQHVAATQTQMWDSSSPFSVLLVFSLLMFLCLFVFALGFRR